MNKYSSDKIDPKVKDILALLGAGAFLAGSILIPGLPILAKPFLKNKIKEEANEWKKFNTWRLRHVLKRLREQKIIDVLETKDGHIVKITEKGKLRLLSYNLDDLNLINKKWDKKWRIVIYDVHESKKQARNMFQKILKKLAFLQLQKSVYLTPYSCDEEVEYIRQIYDIGKDVTILTVNGLENESAYKEYFGLN